MWSLPGDLQNYQTFKRWRGDGHRFLCEEGHYLEGVIFVPAGIDILCNAIGSRVPRSTAVQTFYIAAYSYI